MTIMIYFKVLELYSKVDVLLIAFMFQTSRKEYINVFELNPALYYLLLVIVTMQC